MTVDELFFKALHDKAFFDELAKDPAAALKRVGAAATDNQISALKRVNYEVLEEVARAFGPSRFIT